MFEKCWKCTKIKLMAWDLRMPNEVKMHSTWNSWFKNFARGTLSARTASGLHLLSIHLKEFRLVFSSLLSAIFLAVFGATMEKLQWIWAVQCHVETLFMHFVDTEWSENVCKNVDSMASRSAPAEAWNCWRPERFRPQSNELQLWKLRQIDCKEEWRNICTTVWIPSV